MKTMKMMMMNKKGRRIHCDDCEIKSFANQSLEKMKKIVVEKQIFLTPMTLMCATFFDLGSTFTFSFVEATFSLKSRGILRQS